MKNFIVICMAVVFLSFFGEGSSFAGNEDKSKDAQEQKKQELKEVKEENKEVMDEMKEASKEAIEESKGKTDLDGHDHDGHDHPK